MNRQRNRRSGYNIPRPNGIPACPLLRVSLCSARSGMRSLFYDGDARSLGRSSSFAPRPDQGGPQRSRAAPGGDDATLEQPAGESNAEACSGVHRMAYSASRGSASVHGFRRGTPVRRKSSTLQVTTQRSCRTGRRGRRTGPLSAGDGCRKATSEPARSPQRPELTCGAFPCSVDLIP
jgi:hypothetical protein